MSDTSAEKGDASQLNTTRTPAPKQDERIDLEKLRVSLVNVKVGLNRGSRSGAFDLDESRALSENYEYMAAAFGALERMGRAQAAAQASQDQSSQ